MKQKMLLNSSRNRLFLLAVILSMAMAMLTACGNSGYRKYFPEPAVGQSGTYLASFQASSGIQTVTMIERVEGKEKINGRTYYKTVTIFQNAPGAEPILSYERYDKDGIYAIDTDDPQQAEYLDTPFPLEDGSSWSVQYSDAQVDVRVEGLEDVYLPEKTYENCLKLSLTGFDTGEPVSLEQYYAEGVGMVRQTGTYGDMTVEINLLSDD